MVAIEPVTGVRDLEKFADFDKPSKKLRRLNSIRAYHLASDLIRGPIRIIRRTIAWIITCEDRHVLSTMARRWSHRLL